jgi:hypothetical protein
MRVNLRAGEIVEVDQGRSRRDPAKVAQQFIAGYGIVLRAPVPMGTIDCLPIR